jgi:hypothetical protein
MRSAGGIFWLSVVMGAMPSGLKLHQKFFSWTIQVLLEE